MNEKHLLCGYEAIVMNKCVDVLQNHMSCFLVS